VIPGAAEHRFADTRSKINRSLGLVGAAHAEGHAATDGELVDLGGPVIQTGIHLDISLAPWRIKLMLRPTRSRVVTEIDIVLARHGCNVIKIKSFNVQFMGISAVASWEAIGGWLRLELSPRLRDRRHFFPKIARDWRGFNRNRKTGYGVPCNQA
jgi:hypothetical protein